MIKALFYLILSFLLALPISAQDDDAFFIKKIYNTTLQSGKCYKRLHYLSENIGGRLAGSVEAQSAVEYTKGIMQTMDMDSVWLQECEVPVWQRGGEEEVIIHWHKPNLSKSKILKSSDHSEQSKKLNALSLGNTIGTGSTGVDGEIIEVYSLDTLDKMGSTLLKDKIVFFNRPMDPSQISTFSAYGGAVDQRVYGASRAAKHGAKAVLVRSMTLAQDDHPHTGVSVYDEAFPKIPALAISTNDANQLSHLLKERPVNVSIKNYAKNLPPATSYNVIGEIKGSEFPEEIILVGGHLDSWDVGGGAHDDGAGCVHALDVIEVLQMLDYKPKRTIRCVMFMNEENGLGGGKAYANESNAKGEYHLAAIESDSGGFTPRGFTCTAEDDVFKDFFINFTSFGDLFSPYNLYLKQGGGGADINPLKSQKGLLIGFKPDSQRYFDYHHTAVDRIDAVNERELKMGAAAITSLVYLIDQHGLR